MAYISSNGEINKIRAKIQGVNPTGDPDAGYCWVFVKADGLYVELPAGTVIGPFAASGTPGAHKTSHENGGDDEISVAGLSGTLADAQTPADHDHSGDAGDGNTFDAANLTSGAAGDGDVLTADGVGGAAWEAPQVGSALTVKEVDGAPSDAAVTEIRVTNGKLTSVSPGVVSLDLSGTGGGDATAIHDNESGEIAAITEKTTPVDDDLLIIEDSESTNAKKKLKIGNLPTGAAAIYSIWDPMAPPASPHASDDEFADSSLAVAWTEWDTGNVVTLAEGAYRLAISGASQASWKHGGLYKTMPAGNDLTIWARMRTYGGIALHGFGLVLFENGADSNGDFVTYGLYGDSSNLRLDVNLYTVYTGDPTNKSQIGISAPRNADWFFRIRKVSADSTYKFDYSLNGRTWLNQYSYSSFPFTPSHVGFYFGNRTGVDLVCYADFIRFTADSTFNQILAGQAVSH